VEREQDCRLAVMERNPGIDFWLCFNEDEGSLSDHVQESRVELLITECDLYFHVKNDHAHTGMLCSTHGGQSPELPRVLLDLLNDEMTLRQKMVPAD